MKDYTSKELADLGLSILEDDIIKPFKEIKDIPKCNGIGAYNTDQVTAFIACIAKIVGKMGKDIEDLEEENKKLKEKLLDICVYLDYFPGESKT